MLCTVNNDWAEFNPSPFSVEYHSAPELFELLTLHGFETKLFGAFPARAGTLKQSAVSAIRRLAVALHLFPRSMKGKELLKRVFYGKLIPMPAELGLNDMNKASLTPITNEHPTTEYKVMYAIGRVR